MEQGIVDAGGVLHPADQGSLLGGAVKVDIFGDLVGAYQLLSQIRLSGFFRGLLVFIGGHQIAHIDELVFRILQVQLGFFHSQTLLFHRQIVQGGVEGQEFVALFHGVALFYQNFRNDLGVGEEHGLNFVGGNGAVAFLIVAPVFCHAQVFKGVHAHGLTAGGGCQHQTCHGGNRQNAGGDADDQLLFAPGQSGLGEFNLHERHLPPELSVRRPECGRSCPRIRRWPVRG